MGIDKASVINIARLARIRLNNEDLDELAPELTAIIHWVAILNEIDTSQVKPITSVADMGVIWREDKATDGECVKEILVNAPSAKGAFFAVPKVVE